MPFLKNVCFYVFFLVFYIDRKTVSIKLSPVKTDESKTKKVKTTERSDTRKKKSALEKLEETYEVKKKVGRPRKNTSTSDSLESIISRPRRKCRVNNNDQGSSSGVRKEPLKTGKGKSKGKKKEEQIDEESGVEKEECAGDNLSSNEEEGNESDCERPVENQVSDHHDSSQKGKGKNEDKENDDVQRRKEECHAHDIKWRNEEERKENADEPDGEKNEFGENQNSSPKKKGKKKEKQKDGGVPIVESSDDSKSCKKEDSKLIRAEAEHVENQVVDTEHPSRKRKGKKKRKHKDKDVQSEKSSDDNNSCKEEDSKTILAETEHVENEVVDTEDSSRKRKGKKKPKQNDEQLRIEKEYSDVSGEEESKEDADQAETCVVENTDEPTSLRKKCDSGKRIDEQTVSGIIMDADNSQNLEKIEDTVTMKKEMAQDEKKKEAPVSNKNKCKSHDIEVSGEEGTADAVLENSLRKGCRMRVTVMEDEPNESGNIINADNSACTVEKLHDSCTVQKEIRPINTDNNLAWDDKKNADSLHNKYSCKSDGSGNVSDQGGIGDAGCDKSLCKDSYMGLTIESDPKARGNIINIATNSVGMVEKVHDTAPKEMGTMSKDNRYKNLGPDEKKNPELLRTDDLGIVSEQEVTSQANCENSLPKDCNIGVTIEDEQNGSGNIINARNSVCTVEKIHDSCTVPKEMKTINTEKNVGRDEKKSGEKKEAGTDERGYGDSLRKECDMIVPINDEPNVSGNVRNADNSACAETIYDSMGKESQSVKKDNEDKNVGQDEKAKNELRNKYSGKSHDLGNVSKSDTSCSSDEEKKPKPVEVNECGFVMEPSDMHDKHLLEVVENIEAINGIRTNDPKDKKDKKLNESALEDAGCERGNTKDFVEDSCDSDESETNMSQSIDKLISRIDSPAECEAVDEESSIQNSEAAGGQPVVQPEPRDSDSSLENFYRLHRETKK